MVSQVSLDTLGGIGRRQHNNRVKDQANQIAQLLNQQRYKNAQGTGQGIDLQNEFRKMQNQAQPGINQQNRDLNASIIAKNNAALGPKPIKIPPKLWDYLPPEIQGNPSMVKPGDLVAAAERYKAAQSQPKRSSPAEELNRQKFEYQKTQDQLRQEQEQYKRDNTTAKSPKALTGDQAKSSGFYDRMIAAQAELDNLPEDYEPHSTWQTVRGWTNKSSSPEKQKFEQASLDWIRAKLRKESGAAIGDEEAEKEYSLYFPVYGDGPEVIKQKQRSRKVAENAMLKAAGRAQNSVYKPTPGASAVPQTLPDNHPLRKMSDEELMLL